MRFKLFTQNLILFATGSKLSQKQLCVLCVTAVFDLVRPSDTQEIYLLTKCTESPKGKNDTQNCSACLAGRRRACMFLLAETG